ncbi:MAG: sugar isomerase, partial [Paracoccaceae bacterium]
AQALLVDYNELAFYQKRNDISQCQEILQEAFRTDVRALVREARLQLGGVYDPIKSFRENKIREKLISERGVNSKATGL